MRLSDNDRDKISEIIRENTIIGIVKGNIDIWGCSRKCIEKASKKYKVDSVVLPI